MFDFYRQSLLKTVVLFIWNFTMLCGRVGLELYPPNEKVSRPWHVVGVKLQPWTCMMKCTLICTILGLPGCHHSCHDNLLINILICSDLWCLSIVQTFHWWYKKLIVNDCFTHVIHKWVTYARDTLFTCKSNCLFNATRTHSQTDAESGLLVSIK